MALTLYVVAYLASATDPADDATGHAQIKAGQDGSGAAAAWSGNAAWSGPSTFVDTSGLSAGTLYATAAVVYDDVLASYSNRVLATETFTYQSAALTDSTTATDAVTASYTSAASASESATASDGLTAAATVVAALTDAASASDIASAAAIVAAAITEAATASDSQSASYSASGVASITESASSADSISAAAIVLAAVLEQANATDAAAAAATVVAMLTEVGVAADSVTSGAPEIWNVTLDELASALDTIVAAFGVTGTNSAPPLVRRLETAIRVARQSASRAARTQSRTR